ncbi:hypothetical protein ABPG72_003631 [Tetrahymena utriculariae]
MFGQFFLNKVYNQQAAKQSQYRFRTKMLISIFFGGLVGMKYGYETSQRENQEKYLTEYQGEDWLAYKVKNMKKPIFIVYYTPGDNKFIFFRKFFLEAAQNYNEQCDFVLVNCAKFYHQVKNIDINNQPKIELINTKREVVMPEKQQIELRNPIVKYNKDYSFYGIKCFLEQNGVIDYRTPQEGLIQLYSDVLSQMLV